MAQVKDIIGKIYKGNENTGEVYSFPSKEAGFFVEQTAKEAKMSSLPYVKLKAHYKMIDKKVKEQESKAFAAGHDLYDFEHDKARFEFANTSHGIDLVFVPSEKKKKSA